MFTGYNSNIDHDGKVYHIQTEDKGLGNPILETRIYEGGQVLVCVRSSYADLADSPDYSQDKIQRRLHEQHQSLIRDLEAGRLEPEPVIRHRIDIGGIDADDLVGEYVEDWIETSSMTESVLRSLDQDVDEQQRHQAEDRQLRRQKKKKQIQTVATIVIATASCFAAFELGRVSLLPAPSPSKPTAPIESKPPVNPPANSVESHWTEFAPMAAPVSEVVPPPPATVERSAIEETPDVARLERVEPVVAEEIVAAPTPEPVVAEEIVVAPTPEPVVAEEIVAVPTPELVVDTPPQRGDGPFEMHEIDRPPTSFVGQLPIKYRAAHSGRVRMRVLIGLDGRIDAVKVIDEGADPDLSQAAVDAVLRWGFVPGSDQGVPARVWVPVRLDFSKSGRSRSVATATIE